MSKFKKPLKMLNVSVNTFNRILEEFASKANRVESIDPYMYGSAKKKQIYYTDEYMVCNEDKLVILGLIEDDETTFKRGG